MNTPYGMDISRTPHSYSVKNTFFFRPHSYVSLKVSNMNVHIIFFIKINTSIYCMMFSFKVYHLVLCRKRNTTKLAEEKRSETRRLKTWVFWVKCGAHVLFSGIVYIHVHTCVILKFSTVAADLFSLNLLIILFFLYFVHFALFSRLTLLYSYFLFFKSKADEAFYWESSHGAFLYIVQNSLAKFVIDSSFLELCCFCVV